MFEKNISINKLFGLFAVIIILSGCNGRKNETGSPAKQSNSATTNTTNSSTSLNATISNIQVVNHQIIITGTNLSAVSSFNLKESGVTTTMQIESQSNTSIVANTIANVSFAAGKVFDFVLSSASAAATFTVNFSLCDSTLGGKGFNCLVTPNDKEVLSYDQASGKWIPRAVNGLSYLGTWSALTAQPTSNSGAALISGDYFIVSVASAPYAVGDWIVYNGTSFQRIANANAVTSVFGRVGAIVATEGDYNLTKLSDVDLTIAPTSGQVLEFNGTNWVAATIATGGGGSGTVTSVTSANSDIAVATTTSTPVLTLNSGTGANQIVKLNSSSKLPAVDGSLLTLLNPASLSGTVSIANGGTGASTQAAAQAALGITTAGLTAVGSTSGAIPTVGIGGVVASNICSGAATGGGISCSTTTSSGFAGLISDETGTGKLVFANDPVIGNIAPAANFTLTQNSVVPFTSESVGAIVNTLYLKTGNVGIGTTSPSEKLDVVGNIRASGQLSTGSQTISSGATSTIDWNNGNSILTNYSCASSLTMNNLRDGGTYTLVISDTGTTQCNFGTSTTGTDAATVSYRFKPANAARTTSSYTVYTLMRVGSVVLVSWASGF